MKRPLKIAMVVRAFAPDGGLELYAHQLVTNLLERGHEITVFSQSVRSEFTHPKLSFASIKLRSDRLPKSRRLLHDHRAGNQALAKATGFDIIHSQHYPTSSANVVTFHNHTVHRWSEVGLSWERAINEVKSAIVPAYHLRDLYDKELCARASCLVFPSHVMQEDYYDLYEFLEREDKPFVVAYPGALLNGTASGGDRPPSVHKPFTFLFVGRGYRRKGLDLVLEACRRLKGRGKEFRLIIAGLKAKTLDEVRLRSMGLQSEVSYLGFRNDMEAVYAMADAAVLPSRVEPFGMAPLQAMSYGLVPIVSRVSGVAEVLSHERDCLILDNHLDADELAFHMIRLMDEPALLAQLSRNAPGTAARISWQQTTDKTLEAYAIAAADRTEAAAVK